MKWYYVIAISLSVLLSKQNAQGQPNMQNMPSPSFITGYKIFITTNKTTNLLFPYSIRGVDRGSHDILAQKAKGAENVLQVKADMENFEQTNLSVITADGRLYSFVVNYAKNPDNLNISFLTDSTAVSPGEVTDYPVQLTGGSMTEKQVQEYSSQVLKRKNSLHGVKDHSYDVALKVTGIYVKDDRLFFKLQLKNHSGIDYGIEQLRIFIRDQKMVKRTASQELELQPLYMSGVPSSIKAGNKYYCVLVLPKFTIPDKKYFSMEMSEKNGGRFLHIQIHNKMLMKSIIL